MGMQGWLCKDPGDIRRWGGDSPWDAMVECLLKQLFVFI